MKRRVRILILLPAMAITLAALPQTQESYKLRVAADLANIRLQPDIGSPLVLQVSQGTVLEGIAKHEDWFEVKIVQEGGETVTGYVHESLVVILEGPPAGPPDEKIKRRVPEPKTKVAEEQAPRVRRETKPEEPVDLRFAFSFAGGVIWASAAELNDGTIGLSEYYQAALGVGKEGEAAPLHYGLAIGGGFTFPVARQVALEVGADFISGRRGSQIDYPGPTSARSLTVRTRLRSIPLRAAFVFYPVSAFFFKAGAECHLADCDYFYRFEEDGLWKQWTGEASSTSLGVVAGLGGEIRLQPHLALSIEASVRNAPLKNFKGKDTSTDSEDNTYVEEGSLYSYEVSLAGGESFPLLFIRNKRPSEAGVANARPAVINLSGLSLKAGFKITY